MAGVSTRVKALLHPPLTGEATSLLSASTAVMSVSAVYLCFAGYIFSFFYYRAFGVTLESLDVPAQYYFVHAYTVLESTPGLLLLTGIVLTVSGYSAGKIRRGILLVTLTAAFPLLFFVGNRVAQETSDSVRSNTKIAIVKFKFKDDARKSPPTAGPDSTPTAWMTLRDWKTTTSLLSL
jgi:hypothetical protein